MLPVRESNVPYARTVTRQFPNPFRRNLVGLTYVRLKNKIVEYMIYIYIYLEAGFVQSTAAVVLPPSGYFRRSA